MGGSPLWRPASGCVPCPVHVGTTPAWEGINPLPGFARADGGYFSYPLSAWYLPLSSCHELRSGQQLGIAALSSRSLLFGEIPLAHFNQFLTMGAHEIEGHATINGRSLSKGILRLVANQAYETLALLGHDGFNPARWHLLQHCNAVIARMTTNFALVDEVVSTLVGLDSMKYIPGIDPEEIAAVEDHSVGVHRGYFGPDFEQVYAAASEVAAKAGLAPIHLLAAYAQEPVGEPPDIIVRTGKHPGAPPFSYPLAAPRTCERRFTKGLDLLRLAPYTGSEYRRWTEHEWVEFFSRWLLAFRPWLDNRKQMEGTVLSLEGQYMRWWSDHGADRFNPALGSMLAARHTTMEVAAVAPPGSLKKLVTDRFATEGHQFAAIEEEVRSRSHVLVAAAPMLSSDFMPDGTPKIGGIAVFPGSDDEGGPTPITHLQLHESAVEKLLLTGLPGLPEWVANRSELLLQATLGLQALVFFEGMRTMVAAGEGVRCPLRNCRSWQRVIKPVSKLAGFRLPPETRCCGNVAGLTRMWQAGKQAEAAGLASFRRWEPPLECID